MNHARARLAASAVMFVVAGHFARGQNGGDIAANGSPGGCPLVVDGDVVRWRCEPVEAACSKSFENGPAARKEKGDPSAAASPVCSAVGEQKVAVILFKFPSSPTPAQTPRQWNEAFFSNSSASLNTYWKEVSGGRTWATGDVFGWYTLDRDYTCDQVDDMTKAAIAKLDADANPTVYNRLFFVFPLPARCPWAGLGSISCGPAVSPKYGSFTASMVWMASSATWGLAAHEGGHNLGLGHANTRTYAGLPLGAPGDPGDIEYMGDSASVMGNAGYGGHYSARHKLRLGWLAKGAEIVDIEGEGTFTVGPLAGNAGQPKALRIRRSPGTDQWIWIEYRQPGPMFDSELPAPLYRGALLHYEDGANSGNEFFDTTLLDLTPGTAPIGRFLEFEDAPLVPGRRWSDPFGNLSIEVLNATAGGLTVRIARQETCFALPTVPIRHAASPQEGTIEITAPPGCSWAATTPATWIHLQPPGTGSGPAKLRYSVDANTSSSARIGDVAIGTRTVAILQENVKIEVGPVEPAAGQGLSVAFRFKLTDTRGAQMVNLAQLEITGGPRDGYIRLDGADFKTVSIWEYDTGTLYGPTRIGSAGMLKAKDFAVDLSRSSVAMTATDIEIALAVEFSRSTPAPRTVQVFAWDKQNVPSASATSSWIVRGRTADGTSRRDAGGRR